MFSISLRMLISYLNDVDIQLILETVRTVRKIQTRLIYKSLKDFGTHFIKL